MPHVCTLLLLGTTHLLTSCRCMCRQHTDVDKARSSACGGLLWCVSSWAHKSPALEVWFLYPAHTGSDLRLNLILFYGSPPCPMAHPRLCRRQEALAVHRKAYALSLSDLGSSHPFSTHTRTNLTETLLESDDIAGAREIMQVTPTNTREGLERV